MRRYSLVSILLGVPVLPPLLHLRHLLLLVVLLRLLPPPLVALPGTTTTTPAAAALVLLVVLVLTVAAVAVAVAVVGRSKFVLRSTRVVAALVQCVSLHTIVQCAVPALIQLRINAVRSAVPLATAAVAAAVVATVAVV